jgi:hypothetical protein
MSTRGVIAFGTPAHWRGIYNHSDSAPEWLGPRLWPHLQGDLIAVGERLLRAGRGDDLFAGSVAAEPEIFQAADPVAIEWIYIVDSGERRLHVFGNGPRAPGRWEHFAVGAFSIVADEPDWRGCTRARNRAIAPVLLADIRTRFGDAAYEAARRQMLGDE